MAEPVSSIFPHYSTPAAADYGAHQAAMDEYLAAGEARARQLGNRGPIRFEPGGKLRARIRDAYAELGFYIFESVLDAEELADIEADVRDILQCLPVTRGATKNAAGGPALGVGLQARTVNWTRPLGDPLGGTNKANGRHPAKMIEPAPPAGAPEHIVQLILGNLQFSDACLRVYGHPQLLEVAAQINGRDFVPFNEALWIKHPRLGGSVAWHQDGTTHWDSPELDPDTHGFNFMAQLYGCTPANGVWVVPGSHRIGKADIKTMVAAAGSDRLPDAVPVVAGPGDVVICNRQLVHGSFANTSDQPRVTLNFGFHKRRSVLGVQGGGIHNEPVVYDAARILERSKMIGYAIAARCNKFPNEEPFVYEPLREAGVDCRWNAAARGAIKDYNLLDLGI